MPHSVQMIIQIVPILSLLYTAPINRAALVISPWALIGPMGCYHLLLDCPVVSVYRSWLGPRFLEVLGLVL